MNLLVHKIDEQANLVSKSSNFLWALRPINPSCSLVCVPTLSYEIKKKCKLQQSHSNMKVYVLGCDACMCGFLHCLLMLKCVFPLAFFYKKCMLQPTLWLCVCVFLVKKFAHKKWRNCHMWYIAIMLCFIWLNCKVNL